MSFRPAAPVANDDLAALDRAHLAPELGQRLNVQAARRIGTFNGTPRSEAGTSSSHFYRQGVGTSSGSTPDAEFAHAISWPLSGRDCVRQHTSTNGHDSGSSAAKNSSIETLLMSCKHSSAVRSRKSIQSKSQNRGFRRKAMLK